MLSSFGTAILQCDIHCMHGSGSAVPQCDIYCMHGSGSAVPQVGLSNGEMMCLLSRLPDASSVPALLNARAATCDTAMKMTQLSGRLQGSSH